MNLAERTTRGLHVHVASRVTTLFPSRETRILDVGCGTGSFLARLRGLGYHRLVGVDIAPPSDLAGIDFYQSDLDDFSTPLQAGSIDLAVAVEVIEHVENIGSLLRELSRLLAPTGLVLLTTPNVHSVEARLRLLLTGNLKQFDGIGDPTHVSPIFRHPFERVLNRHGFSVQDVWGFPEDGSSPTSRRGLRILADTARLFGAKDGPRGDQLCMLLGRRAGWEDADSANRKREQLTAHYRD